MRLFVSYVRGDGPGAVSFVTDKLAQRLGAEVYDDFDSLQPGDNFEREVLKLVARCDVFLALIGPHWSATSTVRMEIEAALAANIPLIPVLIGGAVMPAHHDLPPSITPIAHYQAVELSPLSWERDVDRLLAAVEQAVPAVNQAQPTAAQAAEPAPAARAGGSHAYGSSAVVAQLLQQAVLNGAVPAGSPVSGARPLPPSADSPVSAAPPLPADLRVSPAPPLPPPADSKVQAAGSLPTLAERLGGFSLLIRFGAAAASLAVLYEVAKRVLGWFELRAGAGAAATSPEGDIVDCTVFAPPSAAAGQVILVQVFAHLAEQTDDARALATEFDPGTRRRVFQSLKSVVPYGAMLTFELRIRDAVIDAPVQALVWRGRAESVQFEVALPSGFDTGPLIGTVFASLDGAPIGDVRFKLDVGPASRRGDRGPAGEVAVRYRAAFVSYASADRDQVLQRLQMLNAVEVPYFKDLLDLEPGDRWWPRLQAAIDECDLFLLFWSSEAKRSTWVRREVEHALRRQAGDELSPPVIRPVILEGPPIVEPWDELDHLHFNDRVLYFMSPGGGTTGARAS